MSKEKGCELFDFNQPSSRAPAIPYAKDESYLDSKKNYNIIVISCIVLMFVPYHDIVYVCDEG